jgi:hypothetical protein
MSTLGLFASPLRGPQTEVARVPGAAQHEATARFAVAEMMRRRPGTPVASAQQGETGVPGLQRTTSVLRCARDTQLLHRGVAEPAGVRGETST